MLILTRRPGERVVIGGDVTVTVMEVTGQTVRLGIAAPKGLPVYREEIWLAVQAENIAAAESSADALPAESRGDSVAGAQASPGGLPGAPASPDGLPGAPASPGGLPGAQASPDGRPDRG